MCTKVVLFSKNFDLIAAASGQSDIGFCVGVSPGGVSGPEREREGRGLQVKVDKFPHLFLLLSVNLAQACLTSSYANICTLEREREREREGGRGEKKGKENEQKKTEKCTLQPGSCRDYRSWGFLW